MNVTVLKTAYPIAASNIGAVRWSPRESTISAYWTFATARELVTRVCRIARSYGQIHGARHAADRHAIVEHQADDADFEFVSEPAARPPFRGVGHQPGIVFPFGKLSTKPIKHMRVRTVAKQLCSSQVCCIEQRTQRRRHRLT